MVSTHRFLTWMEVFKKYLMNILVDKMIGEIRGVSGGDGFKYGLLSWREDNYYVMEN